MLPAVALAAALLFTAVSDTRAGSVDWSASFGFSAGDSTYVNLSVSHFAGNHDEAVAVARKLRHPERDLPVVLFLARESGRSFSLIVELRNEGLSWWEIRARLGVAPERVIVALPRDPGPPYGKAHGYYKNKNRKGVAATTVVLSDAEVRDWVGVRVLARSFDVDPMVVVEARQEGISLAEFSLQRSDQRSSSREARPASPAGKNKSQPKGKSSRAKGRS